MDSVGGGSSINFPGSVFCGSSRNFPGSIFCEVADLLPLTAVTDPSCFLPLTAVTDPKFVLFKHVLCFARIMSTLCPNSCRQTARIGGEAAPPCPPRPVRLWLGGTAMDKNGVLLRAGRPCFCVGCRSM